MTQWIPAKAHGTFTHTNLNRLFSEKRPPRFMKPIVQEEKTGCAIACSAALAGVSYQEAKKAASGLGISAENPALWSETKHIRDLLYQFGIRTGQREIPFSDWASLPDCALLAIKWHLARNKPNWHWVVFMRKNGKCCVLDSKKSLKNNIRNDFGRMKPKWYIEINI